MCGDQSELSLIPRTPLEIVGDCVHMLRTHGVSFSLVLFGLLGYCLSFSLAPLTYRIDMPSQERQSWAHMSQKLGDSAVRERGGVACLFIGQLGQSPMTIVESEDDAFTGWPGIAMNRVVAGTLEGFQTLLCSAKRTSCIHPGFTLRKIMFAVMRGRHGQVG